MKIKRFFAGGLLPLCILVGCSTQPRPVAPARASTPADAAPAENPVVTFVGSVARPVVPWRENLTLTRAILIAGYQGTNSPVGVVVFRRNQQPMSLDYPALRRGQDIILEPGDRIQIFSEVPSSGGFYRN